MSRNCFILLAVIILSGCAHPRAGGTIKEQRQIQPSQKITILWDVQVRCDNPNNNCSVPVNSIYSKQFEACTNAYFERTFYQNGYSAKAIKVNKAELNAAHVDSPYVLVLRNNSAYFRSYAGGTGMLEQLNVEGELYDTESSHILWRVKSYLSPNAKENIFPAIQLVRALADDGFLNRKIEDVVDYQGGTAPLNKVPERCPE